MSLNREEIIKTNNACSLLSNIIFLEVLVRTTTERQACVIILCIKHQNTANLYNILFCFSIIYFVS